MQLTFTVPTLSTDRQALSGKHGGTPLSAELCRGTEATSCFPIQNRTVVPGETARMEDTLPAALQTGPPKALYYSLTVVNGRGKRSAPSRQAIAVAGAAPSPVLSLAATTTSRGIQLRWQRSSQTVGPAEIAIRARKAEAVRNLEVPGDPGGTIDRSPRAGETITYTVVRSIPLPGVPAATLQGEPATVTVTRAPDTFAPSVPTGLVAVSVQLEGAPPEIDLSWEPAPEEDVMGYLVERAKDDGPPQPIGPVLPAPSARDLAVHPDHVYRYTVRAVDRSGNRSQPSAPATEQLHP